MHISTSTGQSIDRKRSTLDCQHAMSWPSMLDRPLNAPAWKVALTIGESISNVLECFVGSNIVVNVACG